MTVDAAAFCVAGVALGDIDVHPAWQAWDLVTSTFVSGGKRGTFVTSGTVLVLVARLSTHTLSTHNLSQLVHTTCPHTTCRHTFVAHANPSPSLFSFPHFPSHLYLSFASYWKKLTCGVIRSFNFSYYTILYCTILYCAILYYTILCYTILDYIILYFITLYYPFVG